MTFCGLEIRPALSRVTMVRPTFAFALLALSFLPAACTRKPKEPPNLLVVVIDTLRADRLGAYGNVRGFTPFLDESGASRNGLRARLRAELLDDAIGRVTVDVALPHAASRHDLLLAPCRRRGDAAGSPAGRGMAGRGILGQSQPASGGGGRTGLRRLLDQPDRERGSPRRHAAGPGPRMALPGPGPDAIRAPGTLYAVHGAARAVRSP